MEGIDILDSIHMIGLTVSNTQLPLYFVRFMFLPLLSNGDLPSLISLYSSTSITKLKYGQGASVCES
jgi:hypothetical protein